MDALGDRMKWYESVEDRRFMPLIPVIARLDGKNFHAFCRGLQRPYDKRLSDLMLRTTAHLVRETGALTGYTQSDEISLLFYSDEYKSQIFHDGRSQKMVSVLAAMASVFFSKHLADAIPEKAQCAPLFDCRVWAVPNQDEAANTFLWRELDATKNSISMAAHSYYSHKELMEKNSTQKLDMLMEKGINWNEYPAFFKRGQFVQRRKVIRAFRPDELQTLPVKHAARLNPDLQVERTEIALIDMPPFSKVENRVEVLFCGEHPSTGTLADAVAPYLLRAAAVPDHSQAS